jgi:integrase
MSMEDPAELKLNSRNAKTVPAPAKGRAEYFDRGQGGVRGLCLRVTAKGHRSWCVFYRHKGVLRRYTIGDLDDGIGLADARDQAKDVLRRVAKGDDPQAEKKAGRLGDTVRELAEAFIERYSKRRKKSWRKDEQMINRDLLPKIGGKKGADVRRADIKGVLAAIEARGPILANRSLEVYRHFFAWCIAEELGGIATNPCDGIAKPSKERRRERTLSDDEIRAVWAALPTVKPLTACIYRMMFFTAGRLGEAIGMRRAEIVDGNWWVVPASRMKGGREHRVPLTKRALEVIGEADKHNGKGEWLFPSATGDGPVRWIYREHETLLKKTGVSEFTPHDIRRTVASRLGAMGIGRVVIGKILGHADPSVTAVYDVHSYDTEKRQALEAWARRLQEIIEGKPATSNVVTLART